MNRFNLISPYKPAGDQIEAISKLTDSLSSQKNNVLLGVTGSGKTFTMANVIANLNKPAIILAHNKTLAAQLYNEFKGFFPENAVEYFVSYYDYYQPEAYVSHKGLYIEKNSSINDKINLLRLSATKSLFERKDVIVIASVSAIYGLGSPEEYIEARVELTTDMYITLEDLSRKLVNINYTRIHNYALLKKGEFCIRGDCVDIAPAYSEDYIIRVTFFGNDIELIQILNTKDVSNKVVCNNVTIFANSHFITKEPVIYEMVKNIKIELKERISELLGQNKAEEAQRLKKKCNFDIETLLATHSCKGIENYSRYLTQREAGSPPPTLFDYLPEGAITFVDESHVTLPQIRSMYKGDYARKSSLIEHGFRLPSALDNRPLTFEEWNQKRHNTVFVSATPSQYELELSQGNVVEQIIRPTGLLDADCLIRPAENQIEDLVGEIRKVVKSNFRVMVSALTKKMAENLTEYLSELNFKAIYLHHEITTLDRVEIIKSFKRGDYDVLVGINLLREGLDIPSCALVAILSADSEGFLRSSTSLIQTMGRASRNAEGYVILYADRVTKSIQFAIDETKRRRLLQAAYNKKHNITPQTVMNSNNEDDCNSVNDYITDKEKEKNTFIMDYKYKNLIRLYKDENPEKLKKMMIEHADNLEFEKSLIIKDILSKRDLL